MLKRPPSTRTQHSKYSGIEILAILRAAGISNGQFYRDAGLARFTGRSILQSKIDGDIPIKVDPVVDSYLEKISESHGDEPDT